MECLWAEAEDADVFNFQLTEDDMKDTQLMKFYVLRFAPPSKKPRLQNADTKVSEHS